MILTIIVLQLQQQPQTINKQPRQLQQLLQRQAGQARRPAAMGHCRRYHSIITMRLHDRYSRVDMLRLLPVQLLPTTLKWSQLC